MAYCIESFSEVNKNTKRFLLLPGVSWILFTNFIMDDTPSLKPN